MVERPISPRRRPRICHIAATTEGASWVFEQLRELRDAHGFEVAAILNGETGALAERLKAAGIPVFCSDFDFTSSRDVFSLPRKVWALMRLLQRERFDVVQTHLFHSMVIGRVAGWFADVPVSLSMIAGPFHLEAYTPRWIDKATAWMDTSIIASCEFTRTLYLGMGVPARKLELVYYGPDEARFDPARTAPAGLREQYGWAADTPIIGMVAYFYTELPSNRWIPSAVQGRSVKRQEDLIRAVPRILEEFPNAKLVLVGSGWEEGGRLYMERMRALVGELGLNDSVVFTGFRTDVPGILRDLDVSVQASASENLGGTIESLLMECPTVATRVGGMTDSVIDGVTGVLAEPSSPLALADGVLRLLRDRDEARRLAAAGRQHMLARFTLRSTAADLAALYRRGLATAPEGYRALVAIPKFVVGAAVCFAVALRYGVADAWWLSARDLGSSPWQSVRLRASMALSRLYARIGKFAERSTAWAAWRSARQRLRASPTPALQPRETPKRLKPVIESAAPVAAPGRAIASGRLRGRLTALKHRTWYRFLAFVGRNSSFGLRARMRSILSRQRKL